MSKGKKGIGNCHSKWAWSLCILICNISYVLNPCATMTSLRSQSSTHPSWQSCPLISQIAHITTLDSMDQFIHIRECDMQGGTKRCSAVATLHENLSFGRKSWPPTYAVLSRNCLCRELRTLKFASKIFIWHFRLKFSSQIFVWNFCLRFSSDIFVWDFLLRFSSDIFVWDFLLRFSSEIFVWDFRLRFSSEIFVWDFCLKFSSEIFV